MDLVVIAAEGEVVKVLPNAFFRVQLDGAHVVLAHLCGRMRLHKIRVTLGDRVAVELGEYDLTRGRITRVMREGVVQTDGVRRGKRIRRA